MPISVWTQYTWLIQQFYFIIFEMSTHFSNMTDHVNGHEYKNDVWNAEIPSAV